METLIVFAKAPVLGSVKTRLAKERTAHEALVLYAGFLMDIAATCARWRGEKIAVDQNRRLVVYAAPDADDPVMAEFARRAGAATAVQVEGDLGQKLKAAFEAEFQRGARAVCAIGADSPTLPVGMLDEAFRALLWERAVLGPTFDGGYWLVGAQRPAPDLFTDIPWSSPSVLARTLGRLRAQQVEGHLLPFWYDIDEAVDLERLVWHVKTLREKDDTALPNTWAALVEIGLVKAAAPVAAAKKTEARA